MAFSPATRRRGGAGLVGLLLVVVIIMIVLLKGPLSQDEVTHVTMAQTQIDHTAEVACTMNRDSLKATITQFSVMNPGAPPSLTIIRKTGQAVPDCPRGGKYVVGSDGTIYCTKHFPPPPEEAKKLNLTPEPERTPEPLPFDVPIAPGRGAPATPVITPNAK